VLVVQSTGTPQAMASRMTSPKPSAIEGSATRSQRFMSAASWLSESSPLISMSTALEAAQKFAVDGGTV
jgi:hypothetical protein